MKYTHSEEHFREHTSMDVHVLNTMTVRWTKHPVSGLPSFENDDSLPYKRYGHTAVVCGNKIYIWGGRNERGPCTVLYCFDTALHCWTAPKTTGTIPRRRQAHTACVWKNRMFIFGGNEEKPHAFVKTVFYLDLEQMRWYQIYTSARSKTCFVWPAPEPTARDYHTAVVISDKMYLFGGRATINYNTDLWYFDLNSLDWHKPMVTGDIPIGRSRHSAFVHNGNMYIFGGLNHLLGGDLNDLYEFNPLTNSWVQIIPLGEQPCKRMKQACILVGDRVFLFGGISPMNQQLTLAKRCSIIADCFVLSPIDSMNRENYIVNAQHCELRSQWDICFPAVDVGTCRFAKHFQSFEPNWREFNLDVDEVFYQSDMNILDFQPTLKTISILAVCQYKLDVSILPTTVKMDISKMLKPNKSNMHQASPAL